MVGTAQIQKLPKRIFRPKDPKWTREAIKEHRRKGIYCENPKYFYLTEFGRSWEVMKLLRERCLPRLKNRSKPLKVLEVGIGARPHWELFELYDHLMKSGVRFELTALDVQPAVLENVRRVEYAITALYPQFPVQSSYYRTFLGGPGDSGKYYWGLSFPLEVRERIKLLQGDIAACRLPRAAYDIIICMNVLKYLSVPADALAVQNMAEGLKSGGFLFTDRVTGGGLIECEWLNRRALKNMGFKRVLRVPPGPKWGKAAKLYEQFALQKA